MNIALKPVNEIVIPPVPAQPAIPTSNTIRLLHVESPSTPTQMRLYCEMRPCYNVTDAEGNVIDKKFKEPEVQGDITQIPVDNIMPLTQLSPEGEALLAKHVGAYMAEGGNIMAMAFTTIIIAVQQYGIAIGVLKGEDAPVPPEEPIVPDPEVPVVPEEPVVPVTPEEPVL